MTTLETIEPAAVYRDAVFIWIPKVAGSSISRLLEENGARILKRRHLLSQNRNCGITSFGHMKPTSLVETGVISKEYFDNALKFSFVRNPWDRCVSLYFYFTRISSKGRSVINPQTSFTKFCCYLLISQVPHVGYHIAPVGAHHVQGLSQCNPQVDWLKDESGNMFADLVGRYENLENDMERVKKLLGLEGSLPLENVSSRSRAYRDYYNAVTRRIVAYLYKEDIDTFHYSF